MKKAALILAIILVPVILIFVVVIFGGSSSVPPPKSVSLRIWGTKPEGYFRDVISSYSSSRPYVSISYSQVSEIDYRERLIEQWALGTGPDIFAFPADELELYRSFMTPAPATTPNYTYTTKKQFGIKEEVTITKTNQPGPTSTSVKNEFVDVVSTNLLAGGSVYALPLEMESLVLYSNRDLLNQARIALPATTWDEFVQHVPKMTSINSEGAIIRSGASLGTTENITHAFEIIALLVLQNGGSIINANTGSPTLETTTNNTTEEALNFYTDFARVQKSVYSWNETMEQSLNAFASGKVAYYIGLPSDETTIHSRSTALNYDITDMLQIDPVQPVNLAVYKGYGVSKNSKDTATAWNFVQYLTSNRGATLYTNASKATPVRKDLLNEIILDSTDVKLTTYAGQALTAKSWYRGAHKEEVESIMNTIVNGLLTAGDTYINLARDALDRLRILQK